MFVDKHVGQWQAKRTKHSMIQALLLQYGERLQPSHFYKLCVL